MVVCGIKQPLLSSSSSAHMHIRMTFTHSHPIFEQYVLVGVQCRAHTSVIGLEENVSFNWNYVFQNHWISQKEESFPWYIFHTFCGPSALFPLMLLCRDDSKLCLWKKYVIFQVLLIVLCCSLCQHLYFISVLYQCCSTFLDVFFFLMKRRNLSIMGNIFISLFCIDKGFYAAR